MTSAQISSPKHPLPLTNGQELYAAVYGKQLFIALWRDKTLIAVAPLVWTLVSCCHSTNSHELTRKRVLHGTKSVPNEAFFCIRARCREIYC